MKPTIIIPKKRPCYQGRLSFLRESGGIRGCSNTLRFPCLLEAWRSSRPLAFEKLEAFEKLSISCGSSGNLLRIHMQCKYIYIIHIYLYIIYGASRKSNQFSESLNMYIQQYIFRSYARLARSTD